MYAGKIFRLNDRVMQMRNNYEIKLYNRSGKQVGEGVFNGDIGTIRKISGTNVVIEFDGRYMDCPQVLLDDLELSYAITIHKSMGSEYDNIVPAFLCGVSVDFLDAAAVQAEPHENMGPIRLFSQFDRHC